MSTRDFRDEVIMQRFSSRTAIITGGSRGIGLATADRLVREGAKVVITGRDQAVLDAAVKTLGGAEHALGIAGDVTDVDHQRSTIQQAIDTFGSADLLVNNAGATAPLPAIEVDLAVLRQHLELNAVSALSWTQQVHRAWLAEHGGAIVNVASVAALRTSLTGPIYGTSKAMLVQLTTALGASMGPDVRVNAVAPSLVKTELAAPFYEGNEEAVVSRFPLKRLGRPEDVAAGVAFLLSDDAGWITGQLLVIDGGVTLT